MTNQFRCLVVSIRKIKFPFISCPWSDPFPSFPSFATSLCPTVNTVVHCYLFFFLQKQATDLDDDVFTDETGMLCRNRLSTSSVRTWISWQNYRGIPIFLSFSLLVQKAISRAQTYVWPGKRSQFWVKSSGGSKNFGFEKWSFHFCKDDINIADMFKASIRGSGFVEKIRE